MIIKEVLGRLGNIMFCIACGKYISEKNNLELYLDITSETNSFNDYNNINIFNNIKTISGNNNLQIYDEDDPIGFTKIPNIDNIYIKGYRQSEKYWNCDKLWAQNLFKPNLDILNTIYNKFDFNIDECISLHIRRGDYLHFPTVFYTYNNEYYNNIIKQFDSKILIFSDDVNWCKKNLTGNLIYASDYYKKNYSCIYNNLIDLYTMTLCKDNIIDKSTFSWWGAYLNTNKNRKVYYSLPWNKQSNSIDIIPKDNNWINIDN